MSTKRGHDDSRSPRRPTDVFLCGIATDACVLATAIAVFDAGLTPWVVCDACASNANRTPPQRLHNAALMLLDRFVGTGHLIDIEQARSAVAATAARHLGVSEKSG
ncbi:cysteine hydrolase family protein [Nocardia sp. NPDC058499]|uniref:cysteine hydrolase family protein n=1 Tax=Nocardia sp. NPDC058499 TaxID=3346530 RepID=UPI0036613211